MGAMNTNEYFQAGLAAVFAKMSLEGEKSSQLIEAEEQMRKHAWESGHIDYLGKDSFDNILKKLQASMAQSATTPTDAPPGIFSLYCVI